MAIPLNAYETHMMYQNERSPHTLKYETIKNCIFAADVEPSAVDITKLRLWLALVIDDEINPEAQSILDGHRNPSPLPNLECNILCGNSLIDEFAGNKLIPQSDILGTNKAGEAYSWNQTALESLIPRLVDAQDRMFNCDDPLKKMPIREEIDALKDQMLRAALAAFTSDVLESYEESKKMASKPYVLWQVEFAKVFKEKGGFDIVIGNPPYIGEKGNKEIFRPVAATEFGNRFYYGKMDFFYFFFHKALDIGNSSAEVAMITTNYYPTAFGGKLLRKDFKDRVDVRRLINFNELKIFESALGQHNMITMITKAKTGIKAENCICKVSAVADSQLLNTVLYSKTGDPETEYFDNYSVEQDNLYDGEEMYIRIMGCGGGSTDSIDSILQKIASGEVLLKDIAQIKQGIVSGADKYTDAHQAKYGLNHPKGKGIFVLSKEALDELHLPATEVSKYVKEVYKNSQISRYHIV